jgi:peptidoglycan/LPS O-acetylase OafA/YrhL
MALDTKPLPRLTARPDIQGLRALAVGLVVLDHAGVPWFQGGFVGVDVFFVISGFLISSLLLHEATTTGRIRIGQFYARRARRILPAATLVLVATSAFAAAQLSVTRVQEVVQDVRWAALFAANVHFARLGTDYFEEDRAESPVQHFWSLAVEEQFYVFWPVLLLLVCVFVHRRQMRIVTALVGVAWVASLAYSIVLTPASPTSSYFSSATRVWELGTGALLALSGPVLRQLTRRARRPLAVGGMTAIAVAALRYDASTLFPSWRALLPVLGTAALLAAGARGAIGPARALTARPVRYVGDISYSLYLWHWPVLVLGAEYLGGSPSPVETCLLVALAVGLSVLSYHAVENPFRHSRGWALRGRRALVLWPAALAMVVAGSGYSAAYSTNAFEDRISGAGTGSPVSARGAEGAGAPTDGRTEDPAPPPIRESFDAALRMVDADKPIPFPLVNLEGLERDAWHYFFRCYSSWGDGGHRLCPLGDRDAKRTVVVYGDSHAAMWLPALDQLGAVNGFRVVPLVKVGCGPFDVKQWHRKSRFPDCPPYRIWARQQIAKLHPDVILVGYRGLLGLRPGAGETKGRMWSEGVSSGVRRLTKLAPKVVVMSDVATLDFRPGDCLTDPDSTMASCVGREAIVVRQANRITRLASEPLGARFVDVTDLVCVRGRCPIAVDHLVTFRDSTHLSVTWVRRVAPDLGRLLKL